MDNSGLVVTADGRTYFALEDGVVYTLPPLKYVPSVSMVMEYELYDLGFSFDVYYCADVDMDDAIHAEFFDYNNATLQKVRSAGRDTGILRENNVLYSLEVTDHLQGKHINLEDVLFTEEEETYIYLHDEISGDV